MEWWLKENRGMFAQKYFQGFNGAFLRGVLCGVLKIK